VEWDPQAAVTPLGQLPFFIEFLKTSGLFEAWVAECPLAYTSPNAPTPVNVLGTLMLSVLSGHTRYAHIEALRYDGVNPPLLGMDKVMSSSSSRRAFVPVSEPKCLAWMQEHLERCTRPLFVDSWILDVDTHIKVLYGHQEGAVLGYNPKKPGRPSHVLHTYFMANTRLVLGMEVRPGNETAARYTMPGLWAYLDRLDRALWPQLIRGDCAFGTERDMADAEARPMKYLFKLRQTVNVKRLIEQVFAREDWTLAGQGWEGVESVLQLKGWTRSRRVVVLRRHLRGSVSARMPQPRELGGQQLMLIETAEGVRGYEYAVLITNLEDAITTVAQHYRDRGDAENIYDEQSNQWGWGGYTTRDLKRCRLMAMMGGLVYNWWSLFVRLAIPDRHAEAITSRPLLMQGVAKQTTHGGQKTLTITSSHAQTQTIQRALKGVTDFLSSIRATARQLTSSERLRLILSKAFEQLLGGRPLGSPKELPAPG
jgi:hypothetical protein